MIRRKGAEGILPLPAEDKIEILTLLAAAPEEDLRKKALRTLQGCNRVEIRRAVASPQTAPDVLRFAAEHLLAGREELREILLGNPSLPPETRKLLQRKPAPKPAAVEAAAMPPSQPPPEPLPQPPPRETAKESPSKLEPEPAPIPPPKKRRLKFWPSWRQVRRLRM